jgi:hypothetical protein
VYKSSSSRLPYYTSRVHSYTLRESNITYALVETSSTTLKAL